jgi:hypothetical protein
MKITNAVKFGVLYLSAVVAQVCNQTLNNLDNFETNCITFLVGPGTGCQWMCDYCANTLGSNSYYFLPPVCTYQTGGCVGNPQSGVSYSCCTTY